MRRKSFLLLLAALGTILVHLSRSRWGDVDSASGTQPWIYPLGPAARLRAEVLFGPVIFQAPDPYGAAATVRVAWCRPDWCPSVGKLRALGWKQRGYWKNDSRNDLIARLATALSAGNVETLWEHGLFLGGGFRWQGDRPAVAVLVESAEHGRALRLRLPGWRLWDKVPGCGAGNLVPGRDAEALLRAKALLAVHVLPVTPETALSVLQLAAQAGVLGWPGSRPRSPPSCPPGTGWS